VPREIHEDQSELSRFVGKRGEKKAENKPAERCRVRPAGVARPSSLVYYASPVLLSRPAFFFGQASGGIFLSRNP
jgi:hypothetical protein